MMSPADILTPGIPRGGTQLERSVRVLRQHLLELETQRKKTGQIEDRRQVSNDVNTDLQPIEVLS